MSMEGRAVVADGGAEGVLGRGLVKRFGSVEALRGADLAFPRIGVCGLLGPNGAGKTTTIRMIAGIMLPDEGDLRVLGLDARTDGAALRQCVGYLPESAPLYPELTVHEYLRFRAGLLGLSARRASSTILEAARRCDVEGFMHRCCGALSKGMQQRVGLAAAILGDPRIVILDEPSVGLDPGQTLAFRALVRELGASRLVLFSSHLLGEIESVCGELAVIAAGRVILQESIDAFRHRAWSGSRAFAEVDRSVIDDADMRRVCVGLSERALPDGWHRVEFSATEESVRSEAARMLASKGIRMRSLGVGAGLEAAFVELVREAGQPSRDRRDGMRDMTGGRR